MGPVEDGRPLSDDRGSVIGIHSPDSEGPRMYADDRCDPYLRHATSYDDPGGWQGDPLERLTHLVMVDGRLVETWTEPVEGTRWEHFATRFDRELLRLRPTPTPIPPYDQVLGWLNDVCGGAAAVSGLTAYPLSQDGLDLPEVPDIATRQRLEAASELLDAAAARCFDRGPGGETGHALRRALLLVWKEEPETVLHLKSAAHLAGGICWAVGKANGLFGPQGVATQKDVQEALALVTAISAPGTTVQRALQGFAPLAAGRPWTAPDLQPLGRPDLLISRTRRVLLRLRDRAREAKSAAEPVVLP